MHHRYGRHGPRAWLRQRERRYARSSLLSVPVESPLVASTAIVRVFVPTTTERIIVIVMSNIANFEDDDESTEIPSDLSLVSLPQYTDEMRKLPSSPIENKARFQARSDAREIKKRTKNGEFVRIHWGKVKDETAEFAEKAIAEIYPGKETPDDNKFDRLSEEYQKAYLQGLKGRLNKDDDDDDLVDYFDTEHEADLRKSAIADRERYTQQGREHHIRDLAVIRVLLQLDVSPGIAEERLVTIHRYADKYESYYRNPREEVNWPECRGSF
jgi:hypothetical protein